MIREGRAPWRVEQNQNMSGLVLVDVPGLCYLRCWLWGTSTGPPWLLSRQRFHWGVEHPFHVCACTWIVCLFVRLLFSWCALQCSPCTFVCPHPCSNEVKLQSLTPPEGGFAAAVASGFLFSFAFPDALCYGSFCSVVVFPGNTSRIDLAQSSFRS